MTLDCSRWRRYSFTGASQIVMSATVNGRSFVDGESVQFHATGGWDYWGQVRFSFSLPSRSGWIFLCG